MTVPTQTNKITYLGNGSTTLWTFEFAAGPHPDIQVLVSKPDDTFEIITPANFQLVLNPTVDPNPTSLGGSVTYPLVGPPLPVGFKITIARVLPFDQPTSFSNQSIIYPPVLEKALDYLEEQIQQVNELISRSFVKPPDETGFMILPGCPERAGKFLAFDGNCNAIVVGEAPVPAENNAVRVPVSESITELPSAPSRPGTIISFDNAGNPTLIALPPANIQPLLGQRVTVTDTTTIVNGQKGFLIQATGNAFYDVILGDPATYDADFSIAIFNADVYSGPSTGRGKRIMLNGEIMPGGLLWPGQWVYVFRYGATWVVNPRDVRWKPGVQVTFHVDPIAGKDDGTADSLAPGVGAAKTVAFAVAVANARLDYGGIQGASSGGIIQLAQGTYTESILINQNTVGGLPLTIKGANDGVDPTPWLLQVAANGRGIYVDNATTVNVKGIKFIGIGNDGWGLTAAHGSALNVNNCTFGAFPASGLGTSVHIHGLDSSTLNLRDINIVGNAGVVLLVRRQTTARVSGVWNVTSGLTFYAWWIAFYNSTIVGGGGLIWDATDFTLIGGTFCNAIRYIVQQNSIGDLGPGKFDGTLPGLTAGVTGGSAPMHGTDSSMVF